MVQLLEVQDYYFVHKARCVVRIGQLIGGLELALYCDYRIATTSKKTSLGLVEVKLGLLPGMAGIIET